METYETPAPPRRAARGTGLVLAGLVAGVVIAGLGVAGAQAPPAAEELAPAEEPAPGTEGDVRRAPRPFHGRGGFGMGIHGEFTTAAPGGGWQTMASQLGDVTAVSATSITVRSEDGYSRTYRVDDNTLVNAGDDGIADVKTGDDVRVLAVVADGTASAVQIADLTATKALRERWAPAPPAPANG